MNCVAGVEIDTGKWIRLEDETNENEHYAIADKDMINQYGKVCKVFDEVEVLCQDNNDKAKEYYQKENVFIEKGKLWKKNKTWNWIDLREVLEPKGVIKDAGKSICGIEAGGEDSAKMTEEDAEKNKGNYASLQMIKVEKLVIEKTQKGRNHSKASFKYGDGEYRLTVTDPDYCNQYSSQIIPEAFIVCSLGVPFSKDSGSDKYHYLLAAAIIEPANYVVWKADIKADCNELNNKLNNPEKGNDDEIKFWDFYKNGQRLYLDQPYGVKIEGENYYRIGGVCTCSKVNYINKYLNDNFEFVNIEISSEKLQYNDAEEKFASDVEKVNEYLIIRSSIGKIEASEKRSYAGLQRKYGTDGLYITGNIELKDNFDNNGVFVNVNKEKEEKSCLIPTLFQIDKGNLESKGGKIKGNIVGIYDNNIVSGFLANGNIFSASIPELKSSPDDVMTYNSVFSGDFDLILPKNKKNKMLMLELHEKKEGEYSEEQRTASEVLAYLLFKINKAGEPVKGSIEFNLSEKEYEELIIEKHNCKEVILFDEMMGYSFKFKCWTDILPVPGEDDGVFAYVDGSGTKTGGQEERYGTGVVFGINKHIYFCHSEGWGKGSNFTGEIVAATEALNNICNCKPEDMLLEDYKLLKNYDKTIRIYFDNTALGYYPAGLFDERDNSSKADGKVLEYKKARNGFYKKYKNAKLEFFHVDAHFDIFGNEMADRVAQVNCSDSDERKRNKITENHESIREKICPKHGELSEAFSFRPSDII